MGKKLLDNGLFESSRMILPEHKEAWIRREESKKVRTKPVLDDQEVQQIEYLLVESFNKRIPVVLTIFDPIEDQRVIGVVTSINTYLREIKLVIFEDDWQWIKLKDIISASI